MHRLFQLRQEGKSKRLVLWVIISLGRTSTRLTKAKISTLAGLLAYFGFTAIMTITHLLFAVLMTLNILMDIYSEEKDLFRGFSDTDRDDQ